MLDQIYPAAGKARRLSDLNRHFRRQRASIRWINIQKQLMLAAAKAVANQKLNHKEADIA